MRNQLSNSIALAAMLAVSAGVSARADVYRIISQPMVLPTVTRVILPGATTIRTQRIIRPATTTRTTITYPAVITPTTTTTTTVVPVPTTTETTTTITETDLKRPNPPARLHNMMDQITVGESKGLLTAAESASLRAEYSRLDALIQADMVDGLTTSENDDLERQLTIFNQQISNAMQ